MRASALAGARWVLAGNSWEGLIALQLACQAPTKSRRLAWLRWHCRFSGGASVRGSWGSGSICRSPCPGRAGRLVTLTSRLGVCLAWGRPHSLVVRDPARLDAGLRERLLGVSEYRLTYGGGGSRVREGHAEPRLGADLASLASRWIRDASVRCKPSTALMILCSRRRPGSGSSEPSGLELRVDADVGHVPQPRHRRSSHHTCSRGCRRRGASGLTLACRGRVRARSRCSAEPC